MRYTLDVTTAAEVELEHSRALRVSISSVNERADAVAPNVLITRIVRRMTRVPNASLPG